MKKYYKLACLIFIVALNLSCVEKESTPNEGNKREMVSTSTTDTLIFGDGISDIFHDSKGNYWFGIHNRGVSKYDGKKFKYYSTIEGLLDNQIRSVQEDINGNILISTAKGLSIYDGQNFTNYSTNFGNPKLDWNKTKGNLWFYAGEEEGISRFDGINMNYLIFPKPQYQDRYNTYGVTDISKDKDGKVWIATYSTLFNYDGKMVNIFDHSYLKLRENERLHIRSVLADSKGRIWIGNNGIGVLLIEGNSIIHFSDKHHLIHPSSTRHADKSALGSLEHVFAIEEDSEGNIWFGDRDTGAWKYDGNTMKNYTVDKNLKSQMVWTIYNDNNNNLFFGMAEGGVYKFNGILFEKAF